MQEKYTKKACDVLQRAKEAAAKLCNEYIGTEHILLGLTLVQQSVAAKALEGQNVTYHQVMERICEMQGKKQKFYLPLDMTPRAKRVHISSNTFLRNCNVFSFPAQKMFGVKPSLGISTGRLKHPNSG